MNCFNKEDKEWLQKCIEDSEQYKIWIDNDCISVDKPIDEDDYECVHKFAAFGYEFACQLLNHLGCNADYV